LFSSFFGPEAGWERAACGLISYQGMYQQAQGRCISAFFPHWMLLFGLMLYPHFQRIKNFHLGKKPKNSSAQ
jgi:hypothetical protein